MRVLKQPIKVIDNFFEAPMLWRDYALDQTYKQPIPPIVSGQQTTELNHLNMNLFDSLARTLIVHIHDRMAFSFLRVNFTSIDSSYNFGWINQLDPQFNIAGIIFLNKDSEEGTGISFFNRIAEPHQDYEKLLFDELTADPTNRIEFLKHKEEQRKIFNKNMIVENVFNRCVLFPPNVWHGDEKYFGNSLENSRLTINFYGISI